MNKKNIKNCLGNIGRICSYQKTFLYKSQQNYGQIFCSNFLLDVSLHHSHRYSYWIFCNIADFEIQVVLSKHMGNWENAIVLHFFSK